MIPTEKRKWIFILAVFAMTCIAAMVMLQLTAKNNTFYDRDNINILPSFQVRVEWLHVSVVILYTAGLVCTTSTYIHWYFVPLAVFITIQLIYSMWVLLDKDTYIKDQLELSWQDAYNNGAESSRVLQDIQTQWQCQGFFNLSDRNAFISSPLENQVLTSCYPGLVQTFGSTVFVWGVGLWIVKLIQAIGLVACYKIVSIESQAQDMESSVPLLEADDNSISSLESDEDDDLTIVVPTHYHEKSTLMTNP